MDRSQTLLFPERLEDYVAADNPVRFLDAFVASLDLPALQFTKVRTEWRLITLAYNLKRVLNLVSVEKLLLAVS